jgi:hypothetical protein
MTLFDQCVEAAMDAEITLGPADAKAIIRAVLETIRDHTPSPRTVDEMCRVLGEEPMHVSVSALDAGGPLPSGVTFDATTVRLRAGANILPATANAHLPSDPLPPRIGPNCEVVA